MPEILTIKEQKAADNTLGIYLNLFPGKPFANNEVVNSYAAIEFTGLPGTASALYYSFVFWLPKQNFNVVKVDEEIEVSPTHPQYYQIVASQKAALEGTIKASLADAAKAVADYELVAHDLRKYKEIMNYFAKKDEHTLKAMFIDNVDVHTGNYAMVQMVQRWPTIIADFQKLSDEDVDPKNIQKKLNVSEAEAVILTTKNKLYREWKEIFREAVIERYERLRALVEARKKSIDEYRNWIKPYLARYKMMKMGYESSVTGTMRSYFDITGQATFTNTIKIWAFKPVHLREFRKTEILRLGDFIEDPYDAYVRNRFILGLEGYKEPGEKCLADIYPWLRDPRKWCPACNIYFPDMSMELCNKCKGLLADSVRADEMVKKIKNKWKNGQIPFVSPNELYYGFHEIEICRAGSKLPIGEIEDVTFNICSGLITQNILLVRLLELECREKEMENYVNEILGIKSHETSIADIVKKEYPALFEKKVKQPQTAEQAIAKMTEDLQLSIVKMFKPIAGQQLPAAPSHTPTKKLGFVRRGPYESDFFFRITKYYLKAVGEQLGDMKAFLMSKLGVE